MPEVKKWKIRIPGWIPPSKNELRRKHWSREYKLKKASADLLIIYANEAGCPRITDTYKPRRRITVESFTYGQKPDPQNFLDIFCDSLKRARLIVDDSEEWSELVMPTVKEGTRETYVTIEDL